MYRAYSISDCSWSKVSGESGAISHSRNSTLVKKSLKSFLNEGVLDGTKLRSHWFPATKSDVFISHSRNDQEDAIKCASWLKDKFGLEAFIDSCVWGHADDLQKEIDNTNSFNPKTNTYDYSIRNQTTSHVHMMLATALSEMIDSTECVIFLNTSNSISSAKEAISKTKSPWLYFELGSMRTMRRRKPERMTILLENFSDGLKKAAASMELEYAVPLSELTPITGPCLASWAAKKSTSKTNNGPQTLDLLYELFPES
jgi:hypothetical protein